METFSALLRWSATEKCGVNNLDAGDLRRNPANYDVILTIKNIAAILLLLMVVLLTLSISLEWTKWITILLPSWPRPQAVSSKYQYAIENN